MTVVSLKSFHGMIPRLPAQALPEGYAQYALDCKPGHTELRPMFAPGQVAGPMNTSAKGIYSEDGQSFYTWPYDVFSARGPVPSDVHKRMYWTIVPQPGMAAGFHAWDTLGMTANGGSPQQSPFVGVPQPTAAPSLVATKAQHPPPGVTSYTMAVNFWYEKNGQRYQFTSVPVRTVTTALGFLDTSAVAPGNYFSCDVFNIPNRSSTPVTQTGSGLVVSAQAVYTNQAGPEGTTGVTYQIGFNPAGTIQINSASQVTVQTVGGNPHTVSAGQVITGVTGFADANGVFQDMQQYVQAAQAASGTPDDANLVFEMIITDTTSGSSQLLDLVTSNSITISSSAIADSLGDTPTLTADALPFIIVGLPNSYFLQVNWPIFETRAYTYTHVNDWDEESDASPPQIVSVSYASTVGVNMITANDPSYKSINRMRIYRTLTTDQGQTNYQFVGELAVPVSHGVNVNFQDSVPSSALQEVIPSIGWSVPPKNLQCVTAMPNGIMAAFTGNSLYFCDPYHPFAWPEDYIITLPYDIVGMVAHGNGLLVTTKGYPYMVYGVHPEGMSTQKLPILQAGLSARGIVDMGTAVAYVCRDGICVVQGGIGSMTYSSQLFTRKDWRDKYDSHGYSLAQMKLAVYDGAIIAIFPAQNGFIIKLDEEAGFYCESSTQADAAYLLPQTDLYYLGIGNIIYAYGESTTPLILTWQSKDVILPRPSNFGVIQVIADQVPNLSFQSGIEIQVYGDGQLIFDQTIVLTGPSQNIIRRLPSGQKFRRYSVKINGIGYIKELFLASVPSELQNA